MRAHLLASATLAMIPLVAITPRASAQSDPASRAIAYLACQQKADGSLDGSPGETEDLVLDATAAGFDPQAIRSTTGHSPIDALSGLTQSGAAAADAGKTAKLILALKAAGVSTSRFAGVDLEARLESFYHANSGAYGDGATFTQALALLARRALGKTAATAAVSELRALQRSDGGWNSTAATTAQADTNSTAIALMALAAVADHSADSAALSFLHGQQNSDGGFPFQAPSAFGTPSDPDSDALVIQGVVAAGQDPQGPGWAKGATTPMANLLALQDGASGGYGFPGGSGPDAFTTSEVPAALELVPLPITATVSRGIGPGDENAAAIRALHSLSDQQRADGSIDASAGETEDFAIGAAAAGIDPNTLQASSGSGAYDFLRAKVAGATADAGKTAKLILAVVAGHQPTGSFGGVDLQARLASFFDPNTGRYGDGATFTQSLAILAVAASGGTASSAATDRLRALQGTDGSWSSAAAAGQQGDTNSTAVALMALSAVGDHRRDAAALAFLRSQQNSDGGFPFQTPSPFGTSSDPDSDSLVLQAFTATHQDPAAAAWTRNGATVISHLLGAQSSSGGFAFPGSAPDAFTTSEVPAGIERLPYGGATHFATGASLVRPPGASPAPSGGGPGPSPIPGLVDRPPDTGAAGFAPTRGPEPGRTSSIGPLAGVISLLAVLGGGWRLARRRV